MPNLKYPDVFHLNPSPAFDVSHAGGALAPFPGIYRCRCGHEVVAADGERLPTDSHPLHIVGEPNTWRLVAAARRNDPSAPTTPSEFQAPPGWPAGPDQGRL